MSIYNLNTGKLFIDVQLLFLPNGHLLAATYITKCILFKCLYIKLYALNI